MPSVEEQRSIKEEWGENQNKNYFHFNIWNYRSSRVETVQNEKQNKEEKKKEKKPPKVKKDRRRKLVTWKTKRVGDNQQNDDAIAARRRRLQAWVGGLW